MSETPVLAKTDRSRFSVGWGRCPRLRYLNYHAGPDGYGLRLKRRFIPLATGIMVHDTIAAAMLGTPTKTAIAAQTSKYSKQALAAGLQDSVDKVAEEELHWLVNEQCCLIEALTWGFMHYVAPWILSEFEVVDVEREEEMVLGCSCGLGEGGTEADHAKRGCTGILLMARPDMLIRRRSDKALCNLDLKSVAIPGKAWADQWTNNIQLLLGSMAAERRLGEPIEQSYIIGLRKGKREGTWDPVQKAAVGAKRQNTPLCYVYYRPGNPPLEPPDWKTSYYYTDEQGKRRSVKGKGHEKIPVWEAELGDENRSSVEAFVCDILPEAELKEQFMDIGPLQTPRHLGPHLKRALVYEEARWLDGLWAVHDAQGDGPEAKLEALDRYFPQSWECRRFGSLCPYHQICQKDAGWETFFAGEHEDYEPRRPHHQQEVQEMLDRGIKVPEDEEDTDE